MDTQSNDTKIRVLVSGYLGRMGSETVKTVIGADDLLLVGGYDPALEQENVLFNGQAVAPAFVDLDKAIKETEPDVMVDFSLPSAAPVNIGIALANGVNAVIGTTGVTRERLEELAATAPQGTCLFVAPNFTIGAVVMMAAAKLAAPYFEDVEILELHHNNKKDAPSGTAIATAQLIEQARSAHNVKSTAPGSETELADFSGARGAKLQDSDVRLHSIRSNGYVASQEIILGLPGQTLTIRHDSFDRSSYMPGVLLAIRKVKDMSGLVIGLEELMDL